MATNYLVRTIQKRESSAWVESLNDDPAAFVPLSVQPKEQFDGLVVIHRGSAYVFEVDSMVPGAGEDVMCGEDEDQPVRDVVRIYVQLGSMGRYISLIPGFMGIRYMNRVGLLGILATPRVFYNSTDKGYWTHLEEFIGLLHPGQTLTTNIDAVHAFLVSKGFVYPAWSLDAALDHIPDAFPFSLKRADGALRFKRKE